MQTTVQTPLSQRSFNVLINDSAVVESRPEVGSSKKSNLGRVMSSIATHRRFLSPPEIPLLRVSPTITSRQYSIPTVFKASSTRALRSSKGVPRGKRSAAVYLKRPVGQISQTDSGCFSHARQTYMIWRVLYMRVSATVSSA